MVMAAERTATLRRSCFGRGAPARVAFDDEFGEGEEAAADDAEAVGEGGDAGAVGDVLAGAGLGHQGVDGPSGDGGEDGGEDGADDGAQARVGGGDGDDDGDEQDRGDGADDHVGAGGAGAHAGAEGGPYDEHGPAGERGDAGGAEEDAGERASGARLGIALRRRGGDGTVAAGAGGAVGHALFLPVTGARSGAFAQIARRFLPSVRWAGPGRHPTAVPVVSKAAQCGREKAGRPTNFWAPGLNTVT